MRPHRLWSIVTAVCASAIVAPSAAAHPAAPVSSASAAPGLAPLTELFIERMLLADKVAAGKYGTEKPIDDPVREQQILDDVAARAVGLGIDPDDVTAVFRDQIEANKLVQRGLYARWDAHPELRPTERPDLVKNVRPTLDRINTELLAALKDTEQLRASRGCEARLRFASAKLTYDHQLDGLHMEGLARAVSSVCTDP